jgi:(2Fe-2S) ferredoxin
LSVAFKPTGPNDVTETEPFYTAHLFVCTNRRPDDHPRGSCAAAGSEDLRDYLKDKVKELGLRRVRVNAAGCLDRCHLGPVMVIYPEGVWYACRSRADIDAIVESHLRDGKRVDRLVLTNDQKHLRPEQLG